VRDDDAEPTGDYGYDLAHEAAGGTTTPTTPHEHQNLAAGTQTADTQGDYGYDLAHDLPRQVPKAPHRR
jgi:hypothetical protein